MPLFLEQTGVKLHRNSWEGEMFARLFTGIYTCIDLSFQLFSSAAKRTKFDFG